MLRDVVHQHFSDRMAMLTAGIGRDGAHYLFTLRLVPVFPFFLINLLMGLIVIPTRTFFWVSLLGASCHSSLCDAGAQSGTITSLSNILSPSLIGSFALLAAFPWLAQWGWIA